MITNNGEGLFNDVGISIESSPNTKIYNNSIFIAHQNAIEYRFAETTNVDITNNLTNKLITARNGATASLTTNYTAAVSDWFVDISLGNLRFESNISEVVDTGSSLSEIVLDIDQTSRPQMADFDIGAFEYSETIALSPYDTKQSKIILFPNPTLSSLTIKSKTDTITSISIYNSLGNEINTFKFDYPTLKTILNTKSWFSGFYNCHVRFSNNKKGIIKVMVLH